MLIKLTMILP